MPRRTLIGLPVVAILAGCSHLPGVEDIPGIKPYHLEVRQGNIVTNEMLATLKPGMTPQQVRVLLGTPMVDDPFHQDRWDYPYAVVQGDQTKQRLVSVHFSQGKLSHVDGDVVGARRLADTLGRPKQIVEVPPETRNQRHGLLARVLGVGRATATNLAAIIPGRSTPPESSDNETTGDEILPEFDPEAATVAAAKEAGEIPDEADRAAERERRRADAGLFDGLLGGLDDEPATTTSQR